MSHVLRYRSLLEAIRQSEAWFRLIGSRFEGGGGGVGVVHKATLGVIVYSQAYDGAANYHEAPPGMTPYLGLAAEGQASALIASALELMRKELVARAAAAQEEYRLMMDDAGLPVTALPPG